MNVVNVSPVVSRALQLERAPLRFLPASRRPSIVELDREVLLVSNGRLKDRDVDRVLSERHAFETGQLRALSGAFAFARVIGAGALNGGFVELRWAPDRTPARHRVVDHLRSPWALWPSFFVVDDLRFLAHSLPLPPRFSGKDREACNRLWVQALSLR